MKKQHGRSLVTFLIIFTGIIAGILALNPQIYNYVAYGPKVINGLSAKLICSGVFVAGREAEDVYQQDAIPSNGIAKHQSYDVNKQLEEVSVNTYGLYEQKAKFNPGFGCSLYHHNAPQFSLPQVAQIDGFDWADIKVDSGISQIVGQAFNENSSKPHIDTRAMLVVQNGTIIAEQYAPGYDKSSLFLSWSMAKSVISTLVGIWLDTENQSIDQSPGFTEWENDDRKNISLRNLLNMASGLKFEETYEPGDNATRMLFFEDDAAAYARTVKTEAKPDTKWVYSSGTTNILSGFLKSKIGNLEDYYRFAFEKLFLPAGMTSAVFEPDASGNFIGSSYLYMNTRDWAKFGQLYLQNGELNDKRILPEDWVEFVSTPTKAAPRGEYGGQFWLNQGAPNNPKDRLYPNCPREMYLASGHNGQYVAIVPSKQLVIVRLGWANGERFDLNKYFCEIIEAS